MTPEENLKNARHTLAHLLAQAAMEHYPGAQLTLGPAVDNGFYYDVDFASPAEASREGGAQKITDADLAKVEKTMRKNLADWTEFTHKEVSADEAKNIFEGNVYKAELINEIAERGEKITLYTCGNFTDLCRGGHAENPSEELKNMGWKLERIAGAYWRGNEDNKMLTRIYGLAFETAEKLAEYETQMVEAEKRDHRKLGKEMDIFTFDEDVGPGLPLWLPNGGAMIEELEKLAKESEFQDGYVRVRTPHLAKDNMYLTSGHLPYYEDSMYPAMEYEGGKYYLKPMNCPHHHKIFASRPKTYKDLPLRLAEYGTCYRHEKSGELFGLMRVRTLQMNDAHMYCTEEQFADEFRKVNDMYLKYFKIFGIGKYVMRFSTHEPKRLGEKYLDKPELWKKTEDMVRKVLIDSNIPFVEVPNEAAFYGPKIDVQVYSAIGREFTLATNQVDFGIPERFGLVYKDRDGKDKTPLCIHRAPLGTHERFIGFLIEHYAGNFPTWLAPTQVAIVPVRENHNEYAGKIAELLKINFIRAVHMDDDENLGKKIRKAKEMRVPYTIVIGDKEIESNTLTIEKREGEKISLKVEEFVENLLKEVRERK